MNHDQTKQSDLGPYCLQYRLPNKHEPTRGAADIFQLRLLLSWALD